MTTTNIHIVQYYFCILKQHFVLRKKRINERTVTASCLCCVAETSFRYMNADKNDESTDDEEPFKTTKFGYDLSNELSGQRSILNNMSE